MTLLSTRALRDDQVRRNEPVEPVDVDSSSASHRPNGSRIASRPSDRFSHSATLAPAMGVPSRASYTTPSTSPRSSWTTFLCTAQLAQTHTTGSRNNPRMTTFDSYHRAGSVSTPRRRPTVSCPVLSEKSSPGEVPEVSGEALGASAQPQQRDPRGREGGAREGGARVFFPRGRCPSHPDFGRSNSATSLADMHACRDHFASSPKTLSSRSPHAPCRTGCCLTPRLSSRTSFSASSARPSPSTA